MARPRNYHDLITWQKAMALARQAYLLTAAFPKSESYGLQSQIRRAAVSIPSNIAEGHGRLTDLQFRHFLGNARGSLNELQTQLELALDLGFVEANAEHLFADQCIEVARLLNGLIASLRPNPANSANTANKVSHK